MKDYKDIRDDQIRVIGDEDVVSKTPLKRYIYILLIVIVLVAIVAVWCFRDTEEEVYIEENEPSLFEPEQPEEVVELLPVAEMPVDTLALDKDGFVEICDTVINDVPIKIYIPHNAEMSLQLGKMDRSDTTIVYTAQAADVRADNGGIVGAFVVNGKPRAWGLSKSGFCASINGVVTIGVSNNSPLFEEAIEKGGHFFRQYPLVKDGKLVENKRKGKSIRRAICDKSGQIFMVETLTKESFHDFSQVLVDYGVDQAVYLIGSLAYGWAVDKEGTVHEFGDDYYYAPNRKVPRNISYIVWRKKPNNDTSSLITD